jgi:hypothetical protein
MPDGSFSTVLKATVSIVKLTKFFESKGVSVEFKGGLFAANIKLQELNEKNETEVMKNLFIILNKIVANGFDYLIDVSEPNKDDYNYNKWVVNFSITAVPNNNLKNIKEITMSTMNNICLSPEEITNYSNQKIRTHWITINGEVYRFRSKAALIYLLTIFESKIPLASLNFSVSDGMNTFDSVSMVANRRENVIESLPYLSGCNPNKNAIEVNYSVIYQPSGRYSSLNDEVSDFLRSVNRSNFYNANNEYRYNDGTIMVLSPPGLNLDLFNSNQIFIKYCFKKIYSMEQLSKVTEYKVQPIIK